MNSNLFETCPSLEEFLQLISHLDPTEVVTTADYTIYKVRDNFFIGYSIKWQVREIGHSLEQITAFLDKFTNAKFVSPNDIYYSKVESTNNYLANLLKFSDIYDIQNYPEINSKIITKQYTCGYESIWYLNTPFLLYYVYDYNNTKWWLTSLSTYYLVTLELARCRKMQTNYIKIDPTVPLKDISFSIDEFTENLLN